MERIIRETADGSHTLFDATTGESFHSINGAITESMHVFIHAGLLPVIANKTKIDILEVGFGTGLNALLTYLYKPKETEVHYHAVEAFPLDLHLAQTLNYPQLINKASATEFFNWLHEFPWLQKQAYEGHFALLKQQVDLIQFKALPESYDLIYFDAFSPAVQAELWSIDIFTMLYHSLKAGGVLTTYSAKGSVKQALREAGFSLERLDGPPGKRHMLRASKSS
jgi:tRNA U34 5-methylaminomethyl-2-thiouridine-forming methyltransferase MnmC